MVDAFRTAQRPLWVAYYRRALPRFLKVRELLRANAIGTLTSVHVKVTDPLATGGAAKAWRFNTEIAGAGLFLDLASHYFDIIDFVAGPITGAAGFPLNTGGAYAAEDVTAAAFEIDRQGRRHRRVEFQRGVIRRLDRVYGFTRGDRDSRSRRRGRDRHARRPAEPLSISESTARAPAADPDDRRRAARAGDVRVDRRERSAVGVGDG